MRVLVWALSGLLASWAIACSSDGATGGTDVDQRAVEGGLGFIEAIEERIALVVRRHDDEPVRGETLHHGVCRPSGARVAMRVENHGIPDFDRKRSRATAICDAGRQDSNRRWSGCLVVRRSVGAATASSHCERKRVRKPQSMCQAS